MYFLRAFCFGVLIAVWVPAGARAQTGPPKPGPPTQPQAGQLTHDPTPVDTDYAEPVAKTPPVIPATRFVMPDLPDPWTAEYPAYEGRLFSTRFNFAALIDYNAFVQDSDSEAQVGEQRDEWDVRTVRLMFRGQLKFPHPIGYFFSIEVKGRTTPKPATPRPVSAGQGLRTGSSTPTSESSARSNSARSKSRLCMKWSAMLRTCSSRSACPACFSPAAGLDCGSSNRLPTIR